MRELNTFSIAARCPRTGQLGVAVASAVPAVGGLCPFLRAGIGAVTTQSWVNPYLAARILDGLAGGQDPDAALAAALATDDRPDLRQLGLVDGQGRAAAWTGAGCTPAAGHRTGPATRSRATCSPGRRGRRHGAEAFEGTSAQDLDERLMRSLEAGDAAGGDRRGKQSAALKIVAGEDYPHLDLRVDEHAEPVAELRRVLLVARRQLVPFVAGMPGRTARPAPCRTTSWRCCSGLRRAAGRRRGCSPRPAARRRRLRQEPQRVAHLLAQFAPVLAEIARLRDLDLADIHPPVVFDPTLPYRRVPMTTAATDALWQAPITELARRIAARELSSAELVGASLDRIARLDGALNSVVHLSPAALDARARGRWPRSPDGAARPLHGIPIAVRTTTPPPTCPTRAARLWRP